MYKGDFFCPQSLFICLSFSVQKFCKWVTYQPYLLWLKIHCPPKNPFLSFTFFWGKFFGLISYFFKCVKCLHSKRGRVKRTLDPKRQFKKMKFWDRVCPLSEYFFPATVCGPLKQALQQDIEVAKLSFYFFPSSYFFCCWRGKKCRWKKWVTFTNGNV